MKKFLIPIFFIFLVSCKKDFPPSLPPVNDLPNKGSNQGTTMAEKKTDYLDAYLKVIDNGPKQAKAYKIYENTLNSFKNLGIRWNSLANNKFARRFDYGFGWKADVYPNRTLPPWPAFGRYSDGYPTLQQLVLIRSNKKELEKLMPENLVHLLKTIDDKNLDVYIQVVGFPQGFSNQEFINVLYHGWVHPSFIIDSNIHIRAAVFDPQGINTDQTNGVQIVGPNQKIQSFDELALESVYVHNAISPNNQRFLLSNNNDLTTPTSAWYVAYNPTNNQTMASKVFFLPHHSAQAFLKQVESYKFNRAIKDLSNDIATIHPGVGSWFKENVTTLNYEAGVDIRPTQDCPNLSFLEMCHNKNELHPSIRQSFENTPLSCEQLLEKIKQEKSLAPLVKNYNKDAIIPSFCPIKALADLEIEEIPHGFVDFLNSEQDIEELAHLFPKLKILYLIGGKDARKLKYDYNMSAISWDKFGQLEGLFGLMGNFSQIPPLPNGLKSLNLKSNVDLLDPLMSLNKLHSLENIHLSAPNLGNISIDPLKYRSLSFKGIAHYTVEKPSTKPCKLQNFQFSAYPQMNIETIVNLWDYCTIPTLDYDDLDIHITNFNKNYFDLKELLKLPTPPKRRLFIYSQKGEEVPTEIQELFEKTKGWDTIYYH